MEKKYSVMGWAATKGSGPPRYTLRVPVWPADNACVLSLEGLSLGDTTPADVAGQMTSIEKREHFFIFKMLDFPAIESAKAMYMQLAIGLIRLSAATGAALQFQSLLADIARDGDPNLAFREQLHDSEYPSDWTTRADGTRTDGGIFAWDACILPEHERIWEYPASFAKPSPSISLSQLSKYVADAPAFEAAAEHQSIRLAAQALWVACAQIDRRVKYVLLVTTLEILAENEGTSNWAAPLTQTVAEIHAIVQSKATSVPNEILQKFSRKIDEIGRPAMADKIRSLVLRAYGFTVNDGPKARDLIKEVNGIMGRRGALVHGGKFLTIPSADENERLRAIVAAALDQRLQDVGAGVSSPGA